MSEPASDNNIHGAIRSLRWPIVVVIVCLIVLGALIYALNFSRDAADSVTKKVTDSMRAAGEHAGKIAEKFRKGTITQTFVADIPTLTRTPGGNLELATAESVETFTREDARMVAWDWIPLGITVSEIKVPVTYRYHLRLHDPWRLDVSNQTCIVYAPRIRPSQPPAIHTDRMEKRSTQGWARFDGQAQMEELQRSITPTLKAHAGDPKHLALVREECRKTVAEFVRDWLLKEDHWRQDRFSAITVIFEDETNRVAGPVDFTLELSRE